MKTISDEMIKANFINPCEVYRTKEHTVITVDFKDEEPSMQDLLDCYHSLECLGVNCIGTKKDDNCNKIAFTLLN